MDLFTDFSTFLIKGNALDLAIGVVLGTSFGIIVSSLTNDIIMPPIGILLGKMDFKHMKIVIQKKTETNPEVSICYGNFLQNVFNFILTGFALYILVKIIRNYLKL